ncbi:MAG: hypothetical protein EWV61_04195 [Microcystis aeruginosa Ma_AC_P_19900807_S300]|nr:MAG: hypothetical protein EWV61_04195 [Microcystis aeruginosa Ma_AC_P_19900807_S300]
MNANCASYPKVSLGLGFKNPTREDSYLKSATPGFCPQCRGELRSPKRYIIKAQVPKCLPKRQSPNLKGDRYLNGRSLLFT